MDNELSMFEGLDSANVASYWTTNQAKEQPYLGEILFPAVKQKDRLIQFYRGETRAPKMLKPAGYGTQAIPRDRQGLDKITSNTNFFKESKYSDETLMAQLGDLANSKDKVLYQAVLDKIYNDQSELLRGASLTREFVRMQMLLTGKYSLQGNGGSAFDDYMMKAAHQGLAKGASWNETGSDPAYDIQNAKDVIGADQGTEISTMIMNTRTWRSLLANNQIKSTILANNANTSAVALPKKELLAFLLDEYGLTVVLYDKFWEDSTKHYFIPDGKIAFTPGGTLGRTVFAPTPEERMLSLAGKAANISFVDKGVTITTKPDVNPVTLETIVSQEFAPTFERIDDVFVFDAFNAAPKA